MRGKAITKLLSICTAITMILVVVSSVHHSENAEDINQENNDIDYLATLFDYIVNSDDPIKENVLSNVPKPQTKDYQNQNKLLASDGDAYDYFGGDISTSDETIIIGAASDDVGANVDQGSAYLFERNEGGAENWGEVIKLIGSDSEAGDRFGCSVSISGDTVVIGAYSDDVGASTDQGSAYVFMRNQGGPDNWGQVIKLTASDGVSEDRFGISVSLYDDTIFVGAYFDDIGANTDQGSAYVFERNQGGPDNWGQVTKITAFDGTSSAWFGGSVSLFSDTVVIGAYGDGGNQGSAYMFERNHGGINNWGLVTKLTASDGGVDDRFAMGVSLFCDTLVVGAPYHDVGGNNSQGSAYVFERNQGGADNWGEVAKLTASDGSTNDYFGRSVSLSCGSVIVGSNGDDIGGNSGQGSAYVFERNCGGADNWGWVIKLTAFDGESGDQLGSTVSIDNSIIIIGAIGDDIVPDNNRGSAYTFVRSNETWMEIAHPLAIDGAGNDQFGISVDICCDTVVVGARNDDVGANIAQGSAYIYNRNQGGADDWNQVYKLTASDGASNDHFGRSVAIHGNTIVVGSLFDDVGVIDDQGSAYIFERNQGGVDNWGQVTKLTAADGAIDDLFGMSVSIFNDVIIVGAVGDNVGANADQGSAYVFERNQGGPDNWGQVTKLTAADGAVGDMFGRSVSISGDKIVIGAYSDNVGANDDQGSAYIFERNQGGLDNWGQVAKLTAADGAIDDFFGFSVDISGDTVIIGAHQDDTGAGFRQGSGYIFERNQGGVDNWGQVTKLTASDGSANDRFGVSASIFYDTVIIGASHDNVGTKTDQGSAYVFERNQDGIDLWGQVTKLTAHDGEAEEQYGYHISISGDTVIVGAYLDNVSANAYQGSVYIHKLMPEYVIPLNEGWNLVSLPFNQSNTSIDQVLSSIAGKWNYIQAYNTTDPDHWKTNATFKPDQLNDLKSINHKIGFWINITEPRVYLYVRGHESMITQIPLYAGWNLVGYPSLTEERISTALAGTGYDRSVESFNASAPYRISQLADSYMMKPGEAYWIHVPADTIWTVNNTPPYSISGTVYLYDGTYLGGYDPLPSTGGATVDVTWYDPYNGKRTISTTTNVFGQYIVEIKNYTDGGVVFINATFDSPYGNNGYNYTYFNSMTWGVIQDVICGVPYELIITDPPTMQPGPLGLPISVTFEILDRDGMIAQGYYTFFEGPIDWWSIDPIWIPPEPVFFNGTNSPTPGQWTDTVIFNTLGLQSIEIAEGVQMGNGYLTPWGEFYIDPYSVIQGWLRDWHMVMVIVS